MRVRTYASLGAVLTRENISTQERTKARKQPQQRCHMHGQAVSDRLAMKWNESIPPSTPIDDGTSSM